ncbi:MAG TPA: hypothetical protein DCS42_16065 [Nitrospiraceae bacterium]|jgi:7-carboxy-7-deazaguanine synthase|nr:hypothetical protein [Nitrospiraceae bacterium]
MSCIMAPMIAAIIDEIFSSIQGEGIWAGQRQIFVRFIGCDIACRYCDTPDAARTLSSGAATRPCRAQSAASVPDHEEIPNPISAELLTRLCSRLFIPGPSRPVVSLTGGEPLLHASFLADWMPPQGGAWSFYLETSGIHAGEMRSLARFVDMVSMDMKLPSATGLRPFWDEHREFLSAAAGTRLFVKAVVTRDTPQGEIMTAAEVIAGQDSSIPLVLQPASGQYAPSAQQLLVLQEAALGRLPDVRVVPQLHRMLGVL